MKNKIRGKILKYALKILKEEREKWEIGKKNFYFESEEAFQELEDFYNPVELIKEQRMEEEQ